MRWLRIGLFALGGLFALLITVLVLALTLDFGRFKPQIENLVTDLLERELRIDGALHANIGATIDVYAENVFFANPDWAVEPAFATASKIDISVDTLSLLNWPIRVVRADIAGVDGNIEFSGDGRASWTFEKFRKPPGEKPKKKIDGIRADLPVIWTNVLFTGIDVSFNSPEWRSPIAIKLTRGTAAVAEDRFIENRLTGFLNDAPFELYHRAGTIEDFLTMRNVSTHLEGNVGEIRISGNSHVDDVLRPVYPTLDLSIEGPSAEYVTDILGVPRITEGPFGFEATLAPDDDRLGTRIDGAFGEFSLEIDGYIASLQERKTGRLKVDAAGPDIAHVLRLVGIETAEPDPFAVSGEIHRENSQFDVKEVKVSIGDARVTADGEFPNFPMATDAHLSVVAVGPDFGRFNRLFGAPGRLGGEFRTTLDVSPAADGRTLIEANASAPDVSLNLQSRLSSNERFTDSVARLRIQGQDISKLLEVWGIENVASEAFDVRASISIDDAGYLLEETRAIVGDDVFTATGHVGSDPLAGETDLEFDFQGTDLGASIVALGGEVDRLPKGGFHFRGRVVRDGDRLDLRNINAAIGDDDDYEFQLNGFLVAGEKLAGSELVVDAHGASLAALAELARIDGFPDFPFDVSSTLRRGIESTAIEAGRLEVGTVTVDFEGEFGDRILEQNMTAALHADVPDLPAVIAEFGIDPTIIPPGDLDLSLSLVRSDGNVQVQELQAVLGGTTVTVQGELGELPRLSGTELQIVVNTSDLATALPDSYRVDTLAHPFSLTTGVEYDGESIGLGGLAMSLGATEVRGSVSVSITPLLQSGSFSLNASSPDLYELFPEVKEVSSQPVARMRFSGNGHWVDRLWNIDDFDLRLGDGWLKVDGTVDGPPSFERTDLNLDWFASSINNLSLLAGRELPDQALEFKAHLVGTPGEIKADHIEATLGESDFRGDFNLTAGEPLTMALKIDSNIIDISEFQPEPEAQPANQTKPAAEQKPKKDRLIPDTPLPLDALTRLNADVSLSVGELRSRTQLLRDVRLDGSLKDGALMLNELRLVGRRKGTLVARASLLPDPDDGAVLRMKVDGTEMLLGVAASKEDVQGMPTFDLMTVADARGKTVRELAATLNAYVRIVGGPGQVKAGSLAFFTQDFLYQLVSTLNPFASQEPYTRVDCSVALVHAIDGKIRNQPAVVVQTDKLRILGNTNINLQNEKLDVTFRTIPQKGLGLSVSNLVNPYIKVAGTLAKPSLTLDPEGVLIEGGVAVATAGLSILAKGLKDRFLSDKDPCGSAVAAGDKAYEEYLQARETAAADGETGQ